jgi:hypothetical protein
MSVDLLSVYLRAQRVLLLLLLLLLWLMSSF